MMIEACNRSYMLQYDMDNDLLDHILFNMILIVLGETFVQSTNFMANDAIHCLGSTIRR